MHQLSSTFRALALSNIINGALFVYKTTQNIVTRMRFIAYIIEILFTVPYRKTGESTIIGDT